MKTFKIRVWNCYTIKLIKPRDKNLRWFKLLVMKNSHIWGVMTGNYLSQNPNSTINIQYIYSNVGPVFKIIYSCLEACKATFAYTCKSLVGLNGFFLKGGFEG